MHSCMHACDSPDGVLSSHFLSASAHARMHKCMHAHMQLFYGFLDFVRDNSGEPVPEETFTHSHLSWSSIIPYLLPLSIMIHGILSVQFRCLTVFSKIFIQVFFGLSLCLAPSTSYSIIIIIIIIMIIIALGW